MCKRFIYSQKSKINTSNNNKTKFHLEQHTDFFKEA